MATIHRPIKQRGWRLRSPRRLNVDDLPAARHPGTAADQNTVGEVRAARGGAQDLEDEQVAVRLIEAREDDFLAVA
ncbi:MAG: hypothetical protein OEY20_11965 [Gemmatimonadota bacterium]|nr:hypothetical protein [Gemmatimonadota bacterium]MDH5197958.1 hypothetical protein [Gemmatimonadota bacterium]